MQRPELIVLVDDDNAFNTITDIMLRKYTGHDNILKFTCPEKALDFLQNSMPDDVKSCMVFLDINMPALTGWEVLESLEDCDAGLQQKLCVYMVSSSIDIEDERKSQCYQLVRGFVSKPVTREVVRSIVLPMVEYV